MTLRLAQIPARLIEANELSRPQARQLAREGRLLADGRGWLYEIDAPDMVHWKPWNRLTPVVTSTMSEPALTECKRRMLSRTVARVGGVT